MVGDPVRQEMFVIVASATLCPELLSQYGLCVPPVAVVVERKDIYCECLNSWAPIANELQVSCVAGAHGAVLRSREEVSTRDCSLWTGFCTRTGRWTRVSLENGPEEGKL